MKLLEEFGLNEKQINLFQNYLELLLEWNDKFNLTAITDRDEIEEKHFYDSIALTKYVNLKGKTLIDIGSGAGFPGIPLAIVEPSLKVTLLESNGKRITFLKETVKKLGLKNVEIIQGRSEEISSREKYDIVTARAVKELNILLEISFQLVRVGGSFVAYKSTAIDEELKNAQHAFKVLKIDNFKKHEYFLPKSKNSRVFLEILKKNSTPKKYPRSYGEISKQPL